VRDDLVLAASARTRITEVAPDFGYIHVGRFVRNCKGHWGLSCISTRCWCNYPQGVFLQYFRMETMRHLHSYFVQLRFSHLSSGELPVVYLAAQVWQCPQWTSPLTSPLSSKSMLSIR